MISAVQFSGESTEENKRLQYRDGGPRGVWYAGGQTVLGPEKLFSSQFAPFIQLYAKVLHHLPQEQTRGHLVEKGAE